MNLVILISGKQGSGKSTLAAGLLCGLTKQKECFVRTMKFADPLYHLQREIRTVMKRYGEDIPEKDGALLQLLGTEWGRKTRGDDVWVRILQRRLAKESDADLLFSNEHQITLVDDARFENEITAFDFINGLDVFKIRLVANETARKKRADSWRDNTNHPSETGLDNYKGFDITICTDGSDEKETLNTALKALQNRYSRKLSGVDYKDNPPESQL